MSYTNLSNNNDVDVGFIKQQARRRFLLERISSGLEGSEQGNSNDGVIQALTNEIYRLERDRKHVLDSMELIEQSLLSLKQSRILKLSAFMHRANPFRKKSKKSTRSVGAIELAINRVKRIRRLQLDIPERSDPGEQAFVEMLNKLNGEFNKLLVSRTWLMTRTLSRLALFNGEENSLRVVKRMQETFDNFEDWKKVHSRSIQRSAPEFEGILRQWLHQIAIDFRALLDARSWRLGRALVAIFRFRLNPGAYPRELFNALTSCDQLLSASHLSQFAPVGLTDWYLELARAYENSGAVNRAISVLEIARRHDPRNEYCNEYLNRLQMTQYVGF